MYLADVKVGPDGHRARGGLLRGGLGSAPGCHRTEGSAYQRQRALVRRARSQGSNPWQTQGMALGVSRSSSIFLWT